MTDDAGSDGAGNAGGEQGAAALAATVLDEEAKRQAVQEAHKQETILPDDLLPGVGGDPISLREGLRIGGRRTLIIVGLLGFVDFFDNTALTVLAPDIQDSLDVSDTVLAVASASFGLLFLAGSVPISSIADRTPRRLVASVSMMIWSAIVFATGFVVNAFQLFIARLGAGLGQSYSLPVNAPLLMDTYPIEVRARVFAVNGGINLSGRAIAPVFVGAVAAIAGGDEGWRWAFVITGIVALPIALSALTIREPRRGRHEMQAVLGEELEEADDELPISVGVAFERLRKIQSFHFFLTGMAALGFAVLAAPLFINLLLEDEFGLDAFERGILGSLTFIPALGAIAIAGWRADSLFRNSPPRAMVFIGLLVAGFGVLEVVAVWMPGVVLFAVFLAGAVALSNAAFVILPGLLSTLIPYRLRSRGIALIGIYVVVFGGFAGAVVAGLLSDWLGEQWAITLVVLPATLLGGFLISLGARHVRADISAVVEELQEEQEEHERRKEPDAEIPVLQVRNLDFSYGKVQVLFDVAFEVKRGEVLALLGTNGAGKSTILRVVSGLGVAERGVVRLNGRTITYADPELRAKVGVVQLAGGHAIFDPLSVRENLSMACFRYSKAETRTRIERSLETFPLLRDRLDEPAGDLSGGQQQMLALAMVLVHDPEILVIDELSLGLAPTVVQELLEVVERLREAGLTMIIVEQSLNVALAVADRAIFLEKGQVRFEGPAHELAERDDLARAVFLGAEGG